MEIALLAALGTAALSTTLFVVIYMFSPWWQTLLGRILMLQAVSFSMAMDATFLFIFWTPDSLAVLFWFQMVIFGMIALSTTLLTGMVWTLNHRKKGGGS